MTKRSGKDISIARYISGFIFLFFTALGVLGLDAVYSSREHTQWLQACQDENRRLRDLLEESVDEYRLDPIIHVITAYSTDCGQGQSIDVSEWCDGLTATRIPVRRGICAASWDIFPPGTRLYIEGYGECMVADTGGAMRQAGKRGIVHVDVFMDSRQEALNFGRRG